jgi:hypothetical protein
MSEEGENNHKRHWRVKLRTVIKCGKRKNAQEDSIGDFQREDHKTSSRNFSGLQRMMDWILWRGRPPPK